MKARGEAGFSVMELLVAMSLMSVVLTAAFAVLFSGMKAQGQGADAAHAQEKASVAMHKVTHDLRLAGMGCLPGDTVFQFAGEHRISFLIAGPKDSAPELVTYSLREDPDSQPGKLLIKSVGDDSIGQVVSNQISEFSLDYLDGKGESLLDMSEEEPAVKRRRYRTDINTNGLEDILEIRRVSVSITTQSRASRNGRWTKFKLETEVVPRNTRGVKQGDT